MESLPFQVNVFLTAIESLPFQVNVFLAAFPGEGLPPSLPQCVKEEGENGETFLPSLTDIVCERGE